MLAQLLLLFFVLNDIAMKVIMQNLYSTLRRFRLITWFNVGGLAVAFTVFIVLIMQLSYEWSYDRFEKHADCLYRLEITFENGAQAVLSRPLIEAFVASSPHVLQYALLDGFGDKQYVTVENEEKRQTFKELFCPVTQNYPYVFEFEMVEGSINSLNNPDLVLIPQSMAKKFFGNNPAIGKRIEGEGWSKTIGGIYRDVPLNSIAGNVIYGRLPDEQGKGQWMQNNFECFLRLDNPSSAADLVGNFKKNFHHDKVDWKTMDLRIVPLHDVYFEDDVVFDSQKEKGSYLQMNLLAVIALLIVFIAAINFINFSNAKVPMRLKSVNIQKVMGCSTRVIRCSLIFEAVIICLFAYLIALFAVYALSRSSFTDVVAGGMSLSGRIPLLLGVGVFTAVVGAVAGSWPAFYITSFPPALVLKGNFGLSSKGKVVRNILVCLQFTVSFILIIGALFVNKQNWYMTHKPLGFDRDRLAVIDVNNKLSNNSLLLEQKLVELSDIEAVSRVSSVVGSTDEYPHMGRMYNGKMINFCMVQAEPEILKVLGLKPLSGRDFLSGEALNNDYTYIFNEMGRKQFGLEAGSILSFDMGDYHTRGQVVGFMPDMKYNSSRSITEPFAFCVGKQYQVGPLLSLMIRMRQGTDYSKLRKAVEKALHEIDPDYPFEMHLMNDIQENLYQKELHTGRQITFFSLVTVLISLIGVLGVVMFESEYRHKEIGIRKVFGASVRELLLMFNKTYLKISIVCFVIAVPLSYYFVQRWQESFIDKISLSWWIYMLAFLLVTTITLVTVSLQNWHVANVNPVDSIRSE